MKIAVIGAGFTGLAAANSLIKKGNRVVVFEKESIPGGLAAGFKPLQDSRKEDWEWPLETHYHHWFTNDQTALNLAKEMNYEVFTKRPKTSIYLNGHFYQLDSPFHLLKLSELSLIERLRMGFIIGTLRYNPFWKILENINADIFLDKTMGKNAYEKIWKPQLYNKFGKYSTDISLAWFWARIKKRTPNLAYPRGGFLSFANRLVEQIEQKGGKVLFDTDVKEIKTSEQDVEVKFVSRSEILLRRKNYDRVVVTLPSFFFLKIAPQLPQEYKNNLQKLQGLGASNLILRLKNQFLKDGTYWLSICDKNSPVMAIVEHTNFIDKKYYGNNHLVYLANYLPYNHPYMKMDANELLKIYTPYLKKINPNFQLSIINSQLFSAPFAQPIIPTNYSKIAPPLKTPLKNVYLANIQQVYPWDRGTNYAIELGEKVAQLIDC